MTTMQKSGIFVFITRKATLISFRDMSNAAPLSEEKSGSKDEEDAGERTR